jgi:hypothetical protein
MTSEQKSLNTMVLSCNCSSGHKRVQRPADSVAGDEVDGRIAGYKTYHENKVTKNVDDELHVPTIDELESFHNEPYDESGTVTRGPIKRLPISEPTPQDERGNVHRRRAYFALWPPYFRWSVSDRER